ncbi:MAG TPA: polysaccharide biosynthesis C-terminal domain-containing protein, partial [Candidatus Acidoferrales bacterium]|nr:polysaccharide biosynthesis C-terminal domain-containing protein [Candidatus Acidoferrales bacterium]
AVGQYVAAVRISELTETISAAVIFAIFPVLCSAASSPERFGNYVSTVFRMLLFGVSCLCLAVFAGSNFIIAVYYGPQFLSSAPLLRILVWSEMAVFFSAVVNTSLLASARERFVLVPTISGAVLNVALNLVWIPKYGPAGACWATLVSYGIGSTLVLLALPSARGLLLRGWQVLAPSILLLSIALAAIVYLPANAGVRGLIGVAIFVCAAPLFGIIKREDVTFGLQFVGRLFRTADNAGDAPQSVGS